ncbi:ScyD/ScyE family protein [Ensifer aridi]|uniref:ScyD/ScyE family protein n=1 Tax=Ensifer aridi TaxID=1708715 RepID=UPI00358E8533
MRALRTLIAASMLMLPAAVMAAEPSASPDYGLETIHVPGASFAGLARDDDALLVSDLASGRLYRRGPDGGLAAFGPVFPHGLDVIGDPTGPYRVARLGHRLVVAQGWTPVDRREGPLDHALVALDNAGKTSVISNDFWNPFDFVAAADGLYVVDAARNSVEHLRLDGRRNTIVTFRRLEQRGEALQGLSPTEFAKGETHAVDAVPTGVALSNGRLYITLFGGFPFLPGAGKVVSVPAAGGPSAPRLEAEELNAPVAVAFDHNGAMLVLEHGTYDQSHGFAKGSGRLLRFGEGDREVILDGLTRPVSVLVWDGRQLVVSDLGGSLHFLRHRASDPTRK